MTQYGMGILYSKQRQKLLLEAFGCGYDPKFDRIFLKHLEEVYMGSNDLCFCGSGNKQKKCHPGVHENSIIREIWCEYRAIDATILELSQENELQSPCTAGCANCCDTYFYVDMTEYFVMKHHLLSNAPDAFALMKEDAADKMATLAQVDVAEYEKITSPLRDGRDMVDDNCVFHCRCSFLDEDDHCTVYAARPLVCRQYGTSMLGCEKVREQVRRVGDVSKVLIESVYTQATGRYTSYLPMPDGTMVSIRPYPILYWLARDEKHEQTYQQAVGLPKELFIQNYLRSKLETN